MTLREMVAQQKKVGRPTCSHDLQRAWQRGRGKGGVAKEAWQRRRNAGMQVYL